jgi:hypothetical protein
MLALAVREAFDPCSLKLRHGPSLALARPSHRGIWRGPCTHGRGEAHPLRSLHLPVDRRHGHRSHRRGSTLKDMVIHSFSFTPEEAGRIESAVRRGIRAQTASRVGNVDIVAAHHGSRTIEVSFSIPGARGVRGNRASRAREAGGPVTSHPPFDAAARPSCRQPTRAKHRRL